MAASRLNEIKRIYYLPNIIDKISMLSRKSGMRGQIALEFLVVYSFVLVIFLLMFGIVASQRAATLSQQEYASLQLQTQNIANYIDQALSSGSGYSVTIPITGNIGSIPYNLSVSTTGVVIARMRVGTQILSSYAFSNSRNLIINGTLQQTGNGISIYLVPTYKGTLQLSNINGVVYVGQNPPSVIGLTKTISTAQTANVKAATFISASKSYVSVQSAAPLKPTGSMTFDFWINENSYANEYEILQEGIGSGNTQFYIRTRADLGGSYLEFFYGNPTSGYDIHEVAISTLGITPNAWYNVAFSINDSTHEAYVYVNGVQKSSVAATSVSYSQNTNPLTLGGYYWDGYMTGSMANMQIYNLALSQSQALQIYQEGIGAQPLLQANTVGWWPLNGNLNDYSGNGNNGYSYNSVNYSTVAQFDTHASAGTGNSIQSAIVGLIASKGNLGSGSSHAEYTGSTGNTTMFLTANSTVVGLANLTVTAFNGNSSLNGNLIAWWPLDEGYGTKAHDLSTHYLDGNFIGAIWTPLTQNQTNFASGRFPGTGNAVANAIQDGYISINASDSLANIARNSSFTAVAWINVNSINAVRCPGVIGDESYYQSGPGFQLLINSRCGLLWVNSSVVSWPSGSSNFPLRTWEMVAAEYNGTTGQETVYLNGTVFQSGVITKGLSLQQKANYTIADDAFDTPVGSQGVNGLNGTISNVQLYSGYLTPTQINSLYRSGISGIPIGDAGLIGWWPLNGNANDYSSNGNNGVKKFNVTFVNSQFTAKSNSTISVATFNGLSGAYLNATFPNTAVQGSGIYIPQGDLTFDMWFRTTSASGGLQVVGLQSRGSPTGGGCDRIIWLSNGIINFNAWNEVNFNGITTVNDGRWHNLAYVLNQTNGFYTFLDGQPYASSTTATGNCGKGCSGFNSANSYTIGNGLGCRGGSVNGGPFNGQIADVQMYNSILTQYQIQQLYLQGLPIYKKLNVSLG